MPGPHYEVYIKDLTLTSPGGTDTLSCGYVWNTGRQVDDQLVLQYSVNNGNPINWDTVNGATQKTYTPANVMPTGGGASPQYKVQLLTKHNENGNLIQKVVDSIEIQRPTGAGGGIVGNPLAKKTNKTEFFLLARISGQLLDNNGIAIRTSTQTVLVQEVQINQPPGNQNGSRPFTNPVLTVQVQPMTKFQYGWDLGEQISIEVTWSVQPTGMMGTLDLQVNWYNTATSAWESLYENPNVLPSGAVQVPKSTTQCYNDSYQILASLQGATTIQEKKTLSPEYEYPGTDQVTTIDPG